jgi:hypothetical protein
MTGTDRTGLGPEAADALGATGWLTGARPRVAAQEPVRPPGLVAVVRAVRREQRIDVTARLERRADESHPGLLEELAALAVVTALAGRDEVVPGVAAAAVARHDVVERQVVGRSTAVLARMAVAGEHLAASQLDARPGPADLVLQPDDTRGAELRPRRPDHLVVVFDHFGLLAEDESKGSRQVADVERFVVLVEHEDYAVHVWRGS